MGFLPTGWTMRSARPVAHGAHVRCRRAGGRGCPRCPSAGIARHQSRCIDPIRSHLGSEETSIMTFPFLFAGRLTRFRYAAWSSAIFFSQHLIALLVSAALGRPLTVVHFHAIDWQFFAMPLRLLARHDGTSAATL